MKLLSIAINLCTLVVCIVAIVQFRREIQRIQQRLEEWKQRKW